MPPKAPPAETADDDTISAQLKQAYEKGFADGLVAGKPKPTLFEACKQETLKIPAHFDEASVLAEIRWIMDEKMAEYGEKMPNADREVLLGVWRQFAIRRRREAVAAEPPKVRPGPPTGEPVFEYEVVS